MWGGMKYLEHYELPLVFGLCRSRNRLMKAYPDNIKEIGFLAALDRGAPYAPWFAALGATAYWGIGMFGTAAPPVQRRAGQGGGARHRHEDGARCGCSTRTPTCPTTTPASSSPSSGPPSRQARPSANYVELVSAERVGDRWACRLRDTDSGERADDVGAGRHQRRRPVRRRPEPRVGHARPSTGSSTPRASTSSCRA